nr:DDE-type integrase/transposase/recombinase [Rhodoferax sp.]
MPLFSLEHGLVVRRGAQLLEFRRLLDDNKVQFEDQKTRHVQSMPLSRFYAAVLAKQIVPVIGNDEQLPVVPGQWSKPVLITDLSSLGKADKAMLERRMKWVKAVRKRCITRGQRDQVAKVIPAIAAKFEEDKPPSVSTLLGWMRQFELSSLNPAALLSGNRCRKRQPRVHHLVDEVILKKIRSVYLTRSRHTLRHTLDQITLSVQKLVKSRKLQSEDAKVSLATVSRRLAEFPPFERDKARFGVGYARAKYRTTVEGVQAVRAMQRLECDHTLLNWVIVCDRTGLPLGRPTLTIIVDSLSGYVVGIYVSFYGPGLTSVLNVIKNAILPKDELAAAAGCVKPWIAFGIGETILLDNGLEFHSPQFQLAAWELGIDLEYCRVRTPWIKPKVERFFANLDHFSLTKGRVRKPIENVLNIDPKEDASIIFSDFVKGIIRFVVDIYPFELNSRRLQTPYECFKDSIDLLPPPVFPSSFEQLDLIAAMSKTLTVGPGGVDLLGLTYSSTSVLNLKKEVGSRFKTRVKWNPDDMSFVYLQDPLSKQWMPVPSIHSNYTEGLSWIQHRLIRQHARQKHVEGGHIERLLQSRQELHELWMNPLAKRNCSQDMRSAAKFIGMASNQILLPNTSVDLPPLPAAKVIATEEVYVSQEDIPDFDSFFMGITQ